ncbi:MAG: hypothetical protein ACW99L_14960, partial [Promethearchaeota archaeon]
SLLFMVGYFQKCLAIDAVDALNVINQAELKLNSVSLIVSDAYDLGVDVSRLAEKLDIAGYFLSKAYLALRNSDYEISISYAMDCIDSVEEFETEAELLEINANSAKNDNFILTILGSSIGLFLLLIIGFFGWKLLKKHYSRQVLEMQPKLEEDT